MIVIGVVGGIASGKSFVTRQLESLGAVVLDADRIGHQVLQQDAVKAEIKTHWGDEVFLPDGNVDRSALAAIVFDPASPDQLQHLETITHPRIADELRTQIEQHRNSGDEKHVVLDAPVMVKAGWFVVCDLIIFVDADPALRRERASDRGWTRTMFENREARQASIDEKRRVCSHIIDNNGTREETISQVDEFWNGISGDAIDNAANVPTH